jgi:hypothetical protein
MCVKISWRGGSRIIFFAYNAASSNINNQTVGLTGVEVAQLALAWRRGEAGGARRKLSGVRPAKRTWRITGETTRGKMSAPKNRQRSCAGGSTGGICKNAAAKQQRR